MEWKYAMLFALLLAVPMASAANPVKGQLLNSALESIQCRNGFTSAYVSDITNLPNVSGTSDMQNAVSAMQNDYTQLQNYAANNDASGFGAYVKGTYDPDVKTANDAIRNWRKANKLSNDSRTTLKSDYDQLKTTYQSCELTAVKDHANAKVQWYNDVMTYEQARDANLSAKGLDTSGLTTLITDAQNNYITPLQSAINSATDAKGVRSALDAYCLYDGCDKGSNDHFAAKVGIERLNEVMVKIQANNKSANFTTQIGVAQNDLSTANSALTTVGTSAYGPGQSDAVWNPIKEAATQIKEIVAGMRGK